MSELILHIGPHKTGSSTFQLWLKQNAKQLLEYGAAVPVDIIGPQGNGARLALDLCGLHTEPHPKGEIRIQNFSAFQTLHKDKAVLLSAEFLDWLLLYKIGVKPLESSVVINIQNIIDKFRTSITLNEDIYLSTAQSLKAQFAHMGFTKVKLILLLREPAEELTSRYLQQLKKIRHRVNIFNLSTADLPIAKYGRAFKYLHAAGFEISYDVYRAGANSAPIWKRLWTLGGLPKLPPSFSAFDVPDQNISPGYLKTIGIGHIMSLLRIQQHSTSSYIPMPFAQKLSSILGQEGVENDQSLRLFSAAQAQEMREQFFANIRQGRAYANGPAPAYILSRLKPIAPQSPLCWDDLSAPEREQLRAWLTRIAQLVRADPVLSQRLNTHDIRQIGKTAKGPHSCGPFDEAEFKRQWI